MKYTFVLLGLTFILTPYSFAIEDEGSVDLELVTMPESEKTATEPVPASDEEPETLVVPEQTVTEPGVEVTVDGAVEPTVAEVTDESLFGNKCKDVQGNKNFSDKQQECLCSKEELEVHQRDIFAIKADNGASLLELLKMRDQIHAELSMTSALTNILSKYDNFLTENEKLVSQKGLQSNIAGLEKIKNFIKDNKEKVSRYHLVSEVMSTLGSRQELKNKETDQEKIAYIKDSIRNHCANASFSHGLYMCQEDAWENIRLEPSLNQNPRTPGDFLNKLANTMVKLDSNFDRHSIPSLFIDMDNPQAKNPTGLNQFADDLTSMIDKSIDACRKKVLLTNEKVENCINTLPAGEEATRIVRTLKGMGVQGNLSPDMSVGQITKHYLDIAKRTRAFHEETAGGSVKDFVTLIDQVGDLPRETLLVNDNLENDENVNKIRNEFNGFSKQRLEAMAKHLDSLGSDLNDKLFSQYDESEPRPFDEKFNNLFDEIIGINNSKIFKEDEDGRLAIDPNKISSVIKKLIENKDDIERKSRQLNTELIRINQNIAQVKSTQKYQHYNALKDMLWDRVANSCAGLNEANKITIVDGFKCQLNNNGQNALTDLMMINDEIIGYRERQSKQELYRNAANACQSIVQDETQNRKYSDLCNEATQKNAEQVRVDTINAYYRNPKNHNVIYEYDSEGRVVDKYTPKSNLALFLPQAAYTLNEQLPFYFIQRPQMNYAIDQWRFLGKQQKTQQAYWDAWNQSVQNNTACGVFGCFFNTTLLETASPTFGNSGFNFNTNFAPPVSL